jgi:murein DD-endopeptidase MepM/ murein hydrolase activator NlpD
MFTQGLRLRRGLAAVTGNHLVLALDAGGPYAALAHLRNGSLLVRPGDQVAIGQPVAVCGNSGNSTQPHVHIQVMDSAELHEARGLPMAFRDYRAWPKGARDPNHVIEGVPNQRERVEPLADRQ